MAKRYNNFFLEEEPPKKAITPEEITLEQPVVQPEVEATQPDKGFYQPTAEEIPVEQAPVTPEVTPAAVEQPTSAYKYPTRADFEAEVSKGFSPLSAMMKANTPVLDEKKQARLQRIAAVNSIGKGLGTVLQGFYGKKGATIVPDNSTLLPETYKEYTSDLDNYQAKKDLWNKDMMALELKKNDEVNRRVDNSDNKRFQVEQYDKQREAALAEEQRKREYEDLKFERESQFAKDMAAARSVEDQNRIKQQHTYDMQKLGASFANQKALQTQAIEAGRYNRNTPGTVSGVVSRPAGTENNPFAFRSGGKQVILNADQLDIVPDLMNQAAGDGLSIESYNFKKIQERIMKDGKISEAEAREILSKYGDQYYTFENGMAIPKNGAAVTEQSASTGGAY